MEKLKQMSQQELTAMKKMATACKKYQETKSKESLRDCMKVVMDNNRETLKELKNR